MRTGSIVRLTYEGTLDDGTVFGYATAEEPLEFELGQGLVLDALEQAIMEMTEVGEKKIITLAPIDAYGERIEENTQSVPCSVIPPSQRRIGARAYLNTDEGQIIGTCISIDDDVAIYDMNHPLAGQTLTFAIELLGWNDPTEENETAEETAAK